MFLDCLITLLLSHVHATGTMWERSHNCGSFVRSTITKKLNSQNKDFGLVDKENRRFQDKDTHLLSVPLIQTFLIKH